MVYVLCECVRECGRDVMRGLDALIAMQCKCVRPGRAEEEGDFVSSSVQKESLRERGRDLSN